MLARDAVWRGAQKRKSLDRFKSVYSIFISRIDVYTKQHLPELVARRAGTGRHRQRQAALEREPGILEGQEAIRWQQEFIFASTGTKDKSDPPDKYVSALAGSDIQTNPPATNEADPEDAEQDVHAARSTSFRRKAVLDEIDKKVDFQKLEDGADGRRDEEIRRSA